VKVNQRTLDVIFLTICFALAGFCLGALVTLNWPF
jgi:hypothetical protein